ncbi:hypothetical protein BJ742DRAFT_853756 [Cladochytrium replicatum]|nr:hypothetical protein BJ742DRAFT_853756 [Cladochytrium replicatum]
MSSTAFELNSTPTQTQPHPLETQILGLPWKVFAAFIGISVAAVLVIVIIIYVLCARRRKRSYSEESKSRSSSSRSKSDIPYSAIERPQSGDENIRRPAFADRSFERSRSENSSPGTTSHGTFLFEDDGEVEVVYWDYSPNPPARQFQVRFQNDAENSVPSVQSNMATVGTSSNFGSRGLVKVPTQLPSIPTITISPDRDIPDPSPPQLQQQHPLSLEIPRRTHRQRRPLPQLPPSNAFAGYIPASNMAENQGRQTYRAAGMLAPIPIPLDPNGTTSTSKSFHSAFSFTDFDEIRQSWTHVNLPWFNMRRSTEHNSSSFLWSNDESARSTNRGLGPLRSCGSFLLVVGSMMLFGLFCICCTCFDALRTPWDDSTESSAPSGRIDDSTTDSL